MAAYLEAFERILGVPAGSLLENPAAVQMRSRTGVAIFEANVR